MNHNLKMKSPKLYWDDLNEGQEYLYGDYLVTENEIIEFGLKYDPFDFHTDIEKSKQSPIGTLIASGIQTLAIKQRLSVLNVYNRWHLIAGKSLNNCIFIRPVYPNDILTIQLTIQKLMTTNQINKGIAKLKFVVSNQNNAPVLKIDGEVLLLRNPQTNKQGYQ